MSEGKRSTYDDLVLEIGQLNTLIDRITTERVTIQARSYRQRVTIKKMREVISTLRADLQRVTDERDQLYEDRDQDFLAKKELDSMLFARTQELKERTQERDRMMVTLKRISEWPYDIMGDCVKDARDDALFALAAVKPETCVRHKIADNQFSLECRPDVTAERAADGFPCLFCGRPIEQKEEKPETIQGGPGPAEIMDAMADFKQSEKSETCVWTREHESVWTSSCNREYHLTDGIEFNPTVCPHCKKPIEQKEV